MRNLSSLGTLKDPTNCLHRDVKKSCVNVPSFKEMKWVVLARLLAIRGSNGGLFSPSRILWVHTPKCSVVCAEGINVSFNGCVHSSIRVKKMSKKFHDVDGRTSQAIPLHLLFENPIVFSNA